MYFLSQHQISLQFRCYLKLHAKILRHPLFVKFLKRLILLLSPVFRVVLTRKWRLLVVVILTHISTRLGKCLWRASTVYSCRRRHWPKKITPKHIRRLITKKRQLWKKLTRVTVERCTVIFV